MNPMGSLYLNLPFGIISISRWTSEMAEWFNFLVKILIIDDLKLISLMIVVQNITPFVFSPVIGSIAEKSNPVIVILITHICLILNSSLVYWAYLDRSLWYLVYINVFIGPICGLFKSTSYQTLYPKLVLRNQLEKANTIHTIAQSVVYILAIAFGGFVIDQLSGLINLLIDSSCYVVSLILMIIFTIRYGISIKLLDKSEQIDDIPVVAIETVTDMPIEGISMDNSKSNDNKALLDNGTKSVEIKGSIINHMKKYQEIPLLLLINASLYCIWGVYEIVNFDLALEYYGILYLSLMLAFGSTGPIWYFYGKSDHYIINYILLIVSVSCYGVMSIYRSIPIWFVGLWLFKFVQAGYWIMFCGIIQSKRHEDYKGRFFSYNYGIIAVGYAIGSMSGSFVNPYFWTIFSIMAVFISGLIVRYWYIKRRDDAK